MNLDEISKLLSREPLALEMGYERLDNGVMHVAIRTDMHECNGEMFDWWFRSRPDTERYIWWHPRDHISSTWGGDLREDTHVGSEHHAVEELSGLPAQEMVIQFQSPGRFFDAASYETAVREGSVSTAIVGRVGVGHPPARSPEGDVIGGRLLHIGRDTPWGLVMRSHFFVGQDLAELGVPAHKVVEIVPDETGPALLQHAYNEFTFLSRFLPSLFLGANRNHVAVDLPW